MGEKKLDQSLQGFLMAGLSAPGVRIDRASFLRNVLSKHCPENVVSAAIQYNPAKAGISKDKIQRLAENAINLEAAKVTALSAAASLPGGFAAGPAAAADIVSYFAHILNCTPKNGHILNLSRV